MSKFIIEGLPGQFHGDIKTTAVTVSGGPTPLPLSPVKGRKDFLVYNGGAESIYVGGADVTLDTGIPVPAGGSFGIQVGRSEVYALASGTLQPVRVLEVS